MFFLKKKKKKKVIAMVEAGNTLQVEKKQHSKINELDNDDEDKNLYKLVNLEILPHLAFNISNNIFMCFS